MRRFIFVTLLFSLLTVNALSVKADDPNTNYTFEASIGQSSLSHDISFLAFDGHLEIGLPAGLITAPTVLSLNALQETVTPPTGLNLVGSIYQISIPTAAFGNGQYYISLKSSGSASYKQIYFFDSNFAGGWRPLPTSENFGKGLVSTSLTIPFARLAVFENPKVIVKGSASWYRYKGGLFAASPDFPAGTKLRVINLDNKKSVDIVVNDHGPDRTLHPDRVVDLDAVAFARLAPLGQGTMKVAVERLSDTTPIIDLSPTPTPNPEPLTNGETSISAKAALILNSADKKVLWSKSETTSLPLASLTKLTAVKIFLETKPNLKKVVAYSVKDEQMNNLYVPSSVSAKLHLTNGEQMTLKDFVYTSLIGSTNNTIETLVRVSGLTRATFIARMNKRVKDWGAKQTSFIEPTGLSSENVTTASDYAIIAREAFLDPIIADATIQPSYTIKTINTKRSHSFKNTDPLVIEKGTKILGSKTGYLAEAGHCLLTKWPTNKNKNIIIVLLGEPSLQASLGDTKTLVSLAERLIK